VVLCYDSFYIRIFDTVIGIYDDLFHSASITYSFALLVGAIMLQLVVYYPRRLQEPMGLTLNKISYLVLINILIVLILLVLLLLVALFLFFFFFFYTCYDDCLLYCLSFVPLKIYNNADLDKIKILQENRDKAGVYLWQNLINEKKYIGSSVNLYNRILVYYAPTLMKSELKRGRSLIYNSILKYGHENFAFSILEYCEPGLCLEREDYFLQLLKPEYNISKKAAAPFLGRQHSEETRKQISDNNKGVNNFMFGKTHSEEVRNKISASQPNRQIIKVTDIETGLINTYFSISAAARALNISQQAISYYLKNNQQKPYKKRYIFSQIY